MAVSVTYWLRRSPCLTLLQSKLPPLADPEQRKHRFQCRQRLFVCSTGMPVYRAANMGAGVTDPQISEGRSKQILVYISKLVNLIRLGKCVKSLVKCQNFRKSIDENYTHFLNLFQSNSEMLENIILIVRQKSKDITKEITVL